MYKYNEQWRYPVIQSKHTAISETRAKRGDHEIGKSLANTTQEKLSVTEKSLADKAFKLGPRDSITFALTDSKEIDDTVAGLKNGSAPGWDDIPTYILKKNIKALSNPIAHLCNNSFMTGIFLDIFKKAMYVLSLKRVINLK